MRMRAVRIRFFWFAFLINRRDLSAGFGRSQSSRFAAGVYRIGGDIGFRISYVFSRRTVLATLILSVRSIGADVGGRGLGITSFRGSGWLWR